jgi:pilus assembly protein CpaB
MAVVLAVVGALLVAGYVSAADERALQGLETKEVYVVATEVPAETSVSDLEEHLTKEQLPMKAVSGDAVNDLSEFKDRVTAVALKPGEQVLASRLVDLQSLQEPGTVALPKGFHEVTVQLSADRVVGGQVKAGDTVGVFASFDEGPNGEKATELVYHEVLVTSVQGAPTATEEEPEGKAPAADAPVVPEGALLATLALNAAEAEKVVFAAEFGTIWLSNEPEDVEKNDSGVTMEDFFK